MLPASTTHQHKSSLKYLELFLLHTTLSLDCAREELGYSSKITKYKGKVLFLNFLEEVTLKGKFVPYLASF